jgi:hypothetical protein
LRREEGKKIMVGWWLAVKKMKGKGRLFIAKIRGEGLEREGRSVRVRNPAVRLVSGRRGARGVGPA